MQRILSISYCLFCLPPLAVLESVAPEPGSKRIFQGSDVFGWVEEITSSSSVCSEFSPFPKLQESTCASQHYPQKKLHIRFHLYCQILISFALPAQVLGISCLQFMMLFWKRQSRSSSWRLRQSRPCSGQSWASRCRRSSGSGTSATPPSGSGRTWRRTWRLHWESPPLPVSDHLLDDDRVDAQLPHQVGRRRALQEGSKLFQLSLTFFMKLLLRITPLGEPLRGVIGGGFSSSRSPGMKLSSLSESLVQNMSTFVETLRWLLKLTFLISFRISVKSLMSRWWDIMTRMSQSPKPRLNLVSDKTFILI